MFCTTLNLNTKLRPLCICHEFFFLLKHKKFHPSFMFVLVYHSFKYGHILFGGIFHNLVNETWRDNDVNGFSNVKLFHRLQIAFVYHGNKSEQNFLIQSTTVDYHLMYRHVEWYWSSVVLKCSARIGIIVLHLIIVFYLLLTPHTRHLVYLLTTLSQRLNERGCFPLCV